MTFAILMASARHVVSRTWSMYSTLCTCRASHLGRCITMFSSGLRQHYEQRGVPRVPRATNFQSVSRGLLFTPMYVNLELEMCCLARGLRARSAGCGRSSRFRAGIRPYRLELACEGGEFEYDWDCGHGESLVRTMVLYERSLLANDPSPKPWTGRRIARLLLPCDERRAVSGAVSRRGPLGFE